MAAAKPRSHAWLLGAALCAALTAGSPARALLNVDLHSPDSNEGTPSDAYGAAAAQPGRWNVGNVGDTMPQPLLDLQGMATSWELAIDLDGAGHSVPTVWTLPGDETALMDDGYDMPSIPGDRVNFTISGLPAGVYDVYTYGWHSVEAQKHTITIEVGGVPRLVQPDDFMFPGFVEGMTHAVHPGVVLGTAEDLLITAITTADISDDSVVNGFQIVAAPEPGGTWLAWTSLVSLAARARGRSSRRDRRGIRRAAPA